MYRQERILVVDQLIMKYYILKNSTEKKIIGTEYPQIQTMQGNFQRDAPDSIYNVYPNKFPDFVPNLNYFVLERNAKITDIVSASMISYGFIVNNKVKNIFNNFKLPSHKFYPAIINHNGIFFDDYYWFYFVSDTIDFINFEKTIFFITDFFGEKENYCVPPISNANNLRNQLMIIANDKNLDADPIFMRNEIRQFDLFKISGFDFNTYISESLLSALVECGITGFRSITSSKLIV